MNRKQLQERIAFAKEYDEKFTKSIVELYEQYLETLNLLASMVDFKPDPIGIDPYVQIATYCRKSAQDYLKQIGDFSDGQEAPTQAAAESPSGKAYKGW